MMNRLPHLAFGPTLSALARLKLGLKLGRQVALDLLFLVPGGAGVAAEECMPIYARRTPRDLNARMHA